MSELKHYGILGMRWGIRRDRGSDGRVGIPKLSPRQQAKASKIAAKETRKKTQARLNELLNEYIGFSNEMESAIDSKLSVKWEDIMNAYVNDKQAEGDKLSIKYVNEYRKAASDYVSKNSQKLPKGLTLDYKSGSVDGDDLVVNPIFRYNGKEFDFQRFSNADRSFLLEPPDVEIKHYGILGMRWGVRRPRGADGRVGNAPQPSADYLKARALKKKGSKQLSNAEIQEVVNRIRLEQQLSAVSPSAAKKGYEVAKTVLAVGITLEGLSRLAVSSPVKIAVDQIRKASAKTSVS